MGQTKTAVAQSKSRTEKEHIDDIDMKAEATLNEELDQENDVFSVHQLILILT